MARRSSVWVHGWRIQQMNLALWFLVQTSKCWDKTVRRPPEFRLIVIRASLNETFTFASCAICNWLSYLISSRLRHMCAPSYLRSAHLRPSYPISSHLHHICAFSHLKSLFQVFTSSLSPSGLHILKPHVVSTFSDLHHVVALSYLIIFTSCNYYCNFTTWYIYVFKTSSPRSRANCRLVFVGAWCYCAKEREQAGRFSCTFLICWFTSSQRPAFEAVHRWKQHCCLFVGCLMVVGFGLLVIGCWLLAIVEGIVFWRFPSGL